MDRKQEMVQFPLNLVSMCIQVLLGKIKPSFRKLNSTDTELLYMLPA